MRKTRLLLFTAIIMVWILALVAGCGGGSDSGGGGDVSPTPTGSGNISGIVYDQNGSPLQGATVSYETDTQYMSSDKSKSTVTDSYGEFLLTNVPAGYCRVTAAKENYASHIEAYVEAGQTDDVTITVEPVGFIQGTVSQSNTGVTLSGVTVSVTLKGEMVISDISDSNGFYSLDNIYVGAQTVTATKSGYTTQTSSVTVSQGQTSTGNFALVPSSSPTPTPTVSPTITPTPTDTPYDKVYALIIGINDYPGNDDLEFCVPDAQDLKSAFENCSAWNNAEITLLLDNQGDKTAIQNAISNIKNKATSKDLFIMTFSGHGTNLGSNGAICVWDNGSEGYVTDVDLANWISGIACPFYFSNDSCQSGYFIGKNKLKFTKNGFRHNIRLRTTAPGYDPNFKGSFNPAAYLGMENIDNIVIAAAAGGEETADENEELGHGLYTYYVLQGLGTGSNIGPADTNGDGAISGEEAFNYSRPKVVDYSYGDQNPVMADNYPTAANPTGNLVIKK